MRIRDATQGDVAILSLSGKLMARKDLAELHKRVKERIADGITHVVLDMEEVEWLNSAALGVIISALTSCRSAGGDLVVARAPEKVRAVFEITQVLRVFDAHTTTDDAVRALQGEAADTLD